MSDIMKAENLDFSYNTQNTKGGTHWSVTINIKTPEIQDKLGDNDVTNLAKIILECYHWEWIIQKARSWSELKLDLTLTKDVVLMLIETHSKSAELQQESQDLRSKNSELQSEIEKLRLRVNTLETWETYRLHEFSTPINYWTGVQINNMDDFIKFIELKGIPEIARCLSETCLNKKNHALEFLWELFEIWEFPDQMELDDSKKIDYQKSNNVKTWSKNDLMINRITEKVLKEYEWESLSKLRGDGNLQVFYKFALTCFFAGVKLQP